MYKIQDSATGLFYAFGSCNSKRGKVFTQSGHWKKSIKRYFKNEFIPDTWEVYKWTDEGKQYVGKVKELL